MGRCQWGRTAEEESMDCEDEDCRKLPQKTSDGPCSEDGVAVDLYLN